MNPSGTHIHFVLLALFFCFTLFPFPIWQWQLCCTHSISQSLDPSRPVSPQHSLLCCRFFLGVSNSCAGHIVLLILLVLINHSTRRPAAWHCWQWLWLSPQLLHHSGCHSHCILATMQDVPSSTSLKRPCCSHLWLESQAGNNFQCRAGTCLGPLTARGFYVMVARAGDLLVDFTAVGIVWYFIRIQSAIAHKVLWYLLIFYYFLSCLVLKLLARCSCNKDIPKTRALDWLTLKASNSTIECWCLVVIQDWQLWTGGIYTFRAWYRGNWVW